MSEGQTIFRVHRDERERWTNVMNETIRDKRLSFRATGLLVYLLSLPSDWKIYQQQIATAKTEGRDAVVTAFNELKALGYITKEVLRSESGKITGTVWNVFERSDESRLTGKPETAEPETGLPLPENPPLQRTKEKEEPKEETSIASKVIMPDGLDTETFRAAWDEWYAFRRQAKIKKYTAMGAWHQLLRLAEWGEARAVAAIHHSIRQGYQGIYEEKASDNRSTNKDRNAGTFNAGRTGKFAGVEKLAKRPVS